MVVIADSPQTFGMLRQRLSIVTCRWFEQREFITVEILEGFQESLADDHRRGLMNDEVDRDQYLGMSLRELVREFRERTLVLLKCCLLQHKVSVKDSYRILLPCLSLTIPTTQRCCFSAPAANDYA